MQREVAAQLCQALILTQAKLDTPEIVEHLFMFIQPLVAVQVDEVDEDDEDLDEVVR